ncbi:MAG: hypothetical protein PHI63_04395 [Patescibacteria group bacterium]|nr:hypothetical protein [Patescibacteria group bacterium]
MPTGLEKIIALVQRTGDRCIVVDAAGNPAYVILPFEEYERIAVCPLPGAQAVPADSLFEEIQRESAARTAPPEAREEERPVKFPPMSAAPTPRHSVTPASAVDVDPTSPDGSDQYYFEPIE